MDPQQAAKQAAFVRRVFGSPRDPELEARPPGLAPPTLALFGTLDALIPPDIGQLVVSDFLDRLDAFVVGRAPTVIHL